MVTRKNLLLLLNREKENVLIVKKMNVSVRPITRSQKAADISTHAPGRSIRTRNPPERYKC
jgi:hypothetical protein